jgi:endoglucanase
MNLRLFLPVPALIAIAAIASTAPASRSAPARLASFVRVDQVGYPAAASKRAYVLTNADEAGAPFLVRRTSDGAIAFTGTVGPSGGAWSRRFPHVYRLDFDALRTPSVYTLSVGGPAPASSPPFSIADRASVYAAPIANALAFYRNERDGPGFIRSALRTAPGHLNDRHARTYLTPTVNGDGAFAGDLAALKTRIDASGGWWDAGDYLKFVQTTSYTVDLLLAGVRDFPAQLGASAGRSDFTAEARFGLGWLLRMWDDRNRTLYYQMGIGDGNDRTVSDHDIWRLPQADDRYGGRKRAFRYIRHRPAFRAAPPRSPVSPNLAGRDAAAFALCFQVFRRTRPAFAAGCLRAGEHIFDLADTRPRGHLLTAIPFGFYPETEWRDDLELGATELANAVSAGHLPRGLPHRHSSFYLRRASRWARAYITHSASSSEPLNLYDVSGLAHFELVRALRRARSPRGLAVSAPRVVADLRRRLAGALAQAGHDPFGFGFPWHTADTASHGDGLSVMAAEYQNLTGDRSYGRVSTRWLGNVLGANAWGASLIIGDGVTFPHCPQHQVANIVGSLDGTGPVLAGAVVEGPSDAASSGRVEGMRACPAAGVDTFARFNSRAVFRDDVQSYTTVEPAIDLTASSVLAFAWQSGSARPLP